MSSSQVKLDLDRTSFGSEERQLAADRINKLLDTYPQLHYYQGFHDVALNANSYSQLEELALCVLRDFMTPHLDQTLAVLQLVPQLVTAYDPDFAYLRDLAPHYAIASIITLFMHDDNRNAEQIYKLAQSQGLSAIIYLYGALIILNKPLLDQQVDPDIDPDMGPEFLHAKLNRISISSSDWEQLAARAVELQKIPLSSLDAWSEISGYSALKGKQTLAKAAIAARKLPEKSTFITTYTLGMLILAITVQYIMSNNTA